MGVASEVVEAAGRKANASAAGAPDARANASRNRPLHTRHASAAFATACVPPIEAG